MIHDRRGLIYHARFRGRKLEVRSWNLEMRSEKTEVRRQEEGIN